MRSSEGTSTVDHWGWPAIAFVMAVWSAGLALGFDAAVWILTVVGFAASALGLWLPALGLVGIGMLCVLDPFSKDLLPASGLFPWNALDYWLLLVAALHVRRLAGEFPLPMRFLLGLGLVVTAQLIYSGNLEDGIQHAVGLLSTFGLLVYFSKLSRAPVDWYWFGLLSGMTGVIASLAFYLSRGTVPDGKFLVLSAVSALLCICLGYRFVHRPLRRLMLQAAAIANTIWIFLSGSRGSILMATCCLLFLVHSARTLSRRLVLLTVGIALTSSMVVLFPGEVDHTLVRLEQLVRPDVELTYKTSGRSDLVKAGWHMFLNNPLGVGTGNFVPRYVQESYTVDVRYWRGEERTPHSVWIRTLAENGLLGTLLLAGMVVSYAWMGWQDRARGGLPIGIFVTAFLTLGFSVREATANGLWLAAAGAAAVLADTSDEE